ncbi:MAG: ABC transporter ATP-binding protein, partial [Usitatibacter sp.]
MTAHLELDNLTKHYGSVHSVDGIGLAVEKGEFICLLGPSGCGKTTTLRMIAGFIEPDAGEIRARGKAISSPGAVVPPERRHMSMIFQSYAVWPHMTVRQNVAYGLKMQSVPQADRDARADAMLKATKLFGEAGRYPSELSGGQQQRVALARALAPNPDILLLDEPFVALDPRRRVRVRTELRRLQRERGTTVLHVTHDFVEAGTLGDLAMVMDDGRLSQVGTPEALFRTPASGAVAEFLGAENVYSGNITRAGASVAPEITTLTFSGDDLTLIGVGDHPGGAGHAVVRGEDVVLARQQQTPSS